MVFPISPHNEDAETQHFTPLQMNNKVTQQTTTIVIISSCYFFLSSMPALVGLGKMYGDPYSKILSYTTVLCCTVLQIVTILSTFNKTYLFDRSYFAFIL